MMEFQFVGDISDLSNEQREFIGNVLEERGFKNVNIDIQPVGKAGDNYIANVKRITVAKDCETFQVIAKVAPKNGMMRDMVQTAVLFQNEHIMYKEVLPKFTELEKNANIPEEDRLRYATCYGTYLEPPNEIILLEDLDVPGFKMLDRFTSLTDDNVRMVLKNFAMLHSLSYALKYQEPETFNKFCTKLVNFFVIMAELPETIDAFEKLDADMLLLMDDKYKNAVKNVTGQMIPRALELVKIDSSLKFSVIQQGDPWTNNIMFRLEDDNTLECCMIDYQISRRNSPVADLHYMIFNCTDYSTRTKHFQDWIDYYHSQLGKILTKFELNIDNVYPRYQLDVDLKMYAEVSLGLVAMLASMLVRESKDAAKVKEAMYSVDLSSDEVAEQMKVSTLDTVTIKKFKSRVEGVVDSFIELGYL